MAITKGDWIVKQSYQIPTDQKEDCLIYAKDKTGKFIHIAETFQYQNDSHNSANGTSLANAQLMAEAGNVANETGFTPRQLLKQHDKLLDLVEDILKWDSVRPEIVQKLNQVIAETKKGQS